MQIHDLQKFVKLIVLQILARVGGPAKFEIFVEHFGFRLKILLTRLVHNFLRMYPLEMMVALSNGTKIISNGYNMTKL